MCIRDSHFLRLKAIVDQFETPAADTTARMDANTAMGLKLDEQYAERQAQLTIAFEQAAKWEPASAPLSLRTTCAAPRANPSTYRSSPRRDNKNS